MEQTQTFSPRVGLKRTLSDRTLLKVIYYLLFPLSLAFLLPFVPMIIISFEEGAPLSALSFIALALPMPAILMFQAFSFFKPLSFTQVSIFPDRLQMVGKDKKLIEVPFSDIKEVKLSHLPYQGGSFTLVMKDGQSYKFTVILERSEYVLEAISSFNPELLPPQSFELYRRTAICADHNYTRINDALKNWRILVVKYLLLPVIVSVAVLFLAPYVGRLSAAEDWDNVFRAITIVNLVLGVACFLIAALYITGVTNKALVAEPNNARRNMVMEGKVYLIANLVHWVAFAAYVVYFLMS
ncbi:hypothetical protein B9G69_011455 [Bdellovibrio sp. SKB1291214]|uniref:hypothetical protein n=1 Tax=Bdellovibrio sp. SKB1291214 TaxID=1732569 RepID=UPI000B51B223|nr:hypothetical protein [Bdellovibrio sp. SKB1291214]UYL07663.1 hypothetical protein B9G69_011455 [Bdellovibrio sp. SKB1291214]